ncbi:hypothetical protein BH09SUM1_BH09SUM1_02280 [soil metagenome]
MKRILMAGTALLAAMGGSAHAARTFTEQGMAILGDVNLNSRSASFADIDNDGDLDLLFQGSTGARQLYRNNIISPNPANNAMTFTNITSTYGPIANDTTGWSAAWGDYDGDGLVDLFLGETNDGATGDLFRNTGTTLQDVSASTVNDPGFHQNVAWCDIDSDGDLDVIIGMEGPELHEVYLQQPNGSFLQAGASVGIQAPFGTKSYGMAIGDTDDDGDMDIYISTCRGGGDIRNNFFRNDLVETSGTLFLTDIAGNFQGDPAGNGTQLLYNSYDAEFADLDDDGDLDLLVIGSDGNDSKIFRNDGLNQFTDIDTITGHVLFSTTGGDMNGGKLVDYDNDGDLDIFVHDDLNQNGSNEARHLFRNDGDWTFTDVTGTRTTGTDTQVKEGLHEVCRNAYDSAWGDIDLDGDQDLVAATSSSANERVYVSNASTNGNHWLYLRPRATGKNTRAIGAQLYATIHQGTAQERILRRDANTNAGTFNQSDVPVHFGLGDATVVDVLRIVWPDKTAVTLHDVAVDGYMTITEGEEPPPEQSELWMLY